MRRWLRFNLLDGSLAPGLAKEIQQPDDQHLRAAASGRHEVVRRIRPDRRGCGLHVRAWPRTASVNFATIWQYVDSITATDPGLSQFKLKSKPFNPIIVKQFICQTLIVPKASSAASRRTRSQPIPTSSPLVPGPSCWTSTTRPRSISSETTTTGARPHLATRR